MDGRLIVFATDAPLLGNDTNGLSDIYAYHAPTRQLTLVSTGLTGRAGSGASDWPAMDAWAERTVFQSSADDLVADDGNAVSDIFLYESSSGWLRNLTATAAGNSEHPSLDATGEALVYDRATETGARAVLRRDPAYDEETPLAARLTDSHRPAISADGRYLVWLEGDGLARFRDDESGLETGVPVPPELHSRTERVRPVFAGEGGTVEWVILGEDRCLFTTNPLAR